MKNALRQSFYILGVAVISFGFFGVHLALGATIYYQGDHSGSIHVGPGVVSTIGSFVTPSSPTYCFPASIGTQSLISFTVRNNNVTGGQGVEIGLSPVMNAFPVGAGALNPSITTSGSGSGFVTYTAGLESNVTSHDCLTPSTTYYIIVYLNNGSGSDWETESLNINMAGYISDDGGYVPPPPADTTTHIVDFTPEDNATTSNPVTFSIHAYINPADLGSYIGVHLNLHNTDENVFLLSGLSPSDFDVFDFQATTSGDVIMSTSTTIGEGNYRVDASLERTYLNGWVENPFSPINRTISHQFIVGTSTLIGNLSAHVYKDISVILGQTGATTTDALAGNCYPFPGSWDTVKCLLFLFTPPGPELNDTVVSFKDDIATRFPWGYLTRFIDIMSNSATSSLPTFTANVMTDASTTMEIISVDPNDMIAGGGALLDSIQDPTYHKTVRDVTQPFVQLGVALGVILTIVADLMGSHKHHVNAQDRTQRKTTLS